MDADTNANDNANANAGGSTIALRELCSGELKMSPKDAYGMANSVDPDQTAPKGAKSVDPDQTALSENIGPLPYANTV